MAKIKTRLDERLTKDFPNASRTYLQSLIMQGKVSVDGAIVTKPGTQVAANAVINVDFEEPKYVSRAGFKLEKALDHFDLDVGGMIVLDAGLSTGGFADCLLQHGAKKIYGIDVGYGQVHEKIKNDSRVVVMERTNLRHLERLPEVVDLATLDLSFISLLKVIDVVAAQLKPDGSLITLIKPQFEAKRHQIAAGGIVKDEQVHKEILKKVTEGIEQRGFKLIGVIESPIQGSAGNKEFLAYFKRPAL